MNGVLFYYFKLYLKNSLNPVEVATITGHKDTRMLMRYTRLGAEDLVSGFILL